MNLEQKIKILSKLGDIFHALGCDEEWQGYDLGINKEEYEEFKSLLETVYIYNGWFIPASVKNSLRGLSKWLNEKELRNWVSNYSLTENNTKTVGIIMAGNIPLVGFHDFISVFLSGHKSKIKLSSNDQHLFKAVLKMLSLFDETINDLVEVTEGPLKDFDAVIATGSDNSSSHFESYFSAYPHIIRKNRTSIAILDGTETIDELKMLGKDIFNYFGLGCRNVSHLWIPKDFDLNKFFEAIYDFNDIVNHNKYANNYDYNKAVYLLNQDDLLDNGFVLLKEDDQLHSPLGMLFYSRYEDKKEVDAYIQNHTSKIQAIVGKENIAFGQSQCPALNDYADNIDTMEFLTGL